MHSISGFSLIETMVSMLLITLTFIGINAAHLVAIKEAKSVYYYSVALMQAKMLSAVLVKTSIESDVMLEERHMRQISKILPHGRLVLKRDSSTISAINIFWGDNRASVCEQDTIAPSGCLNFRLMV